MERIIIPSPLRKGEFMHCEEQEYQVIEFLQVGVQPTRDEDDNDEDVVGLVYRVRDTRTNHVVNIIIPFCIEHDEKEEDNYFQILELKEDKKEVTLKSWLTGVERKMKVRWDEDVEVIGDGLKEEDKDLFCTLKEVMGKEVIGDFQLVEKDHPIMRMPNEIMEIVFSKLTPEDRLSCRLVTRIWTPLLPINQFVKCIKLFIEHDPEELGPNTIVAEFHRLDIPSHPFVEYGVIRDRLMEEAYLNEELGYNNPRNRMNDLEPLVNASLLDDVEYLSVYTNTKSRMEQHMQTTVSQHCCNLHEFFFEDKTEETDVVESNWMWAKQIIAANKHRLKKISLKITSLREVDLSSDYQIGEGNSLGYLHLDIIKCPTNSVLNYLESVPTSITNLTIGSITIFTKSNLLRIASKFPHLEYAYLRVHHYHSDNTDSMDEDEVDGSTIVQVLNGLSYLQTLSLQLGPYIVEGRRRVVCGKARHLRDQGLAPRFHYFPYPIGSAAEAYETLQFLRI